MRKYYDMERRICRNGELELSVLGLGCWAFGGGDYWGRQDQSDVDRVVRTAFDAGINYFDTAEVYNEGRSESSLGKAIRGLPRDQLLIGTKVSPSNCYPGTLVKHCEDSLRRLGTDHIDLYMVHWPIHSHAVKYFTRNEGVVQNPPDTELAFQTLQDLKKQGKIGHIGVSNYGKPRLAEVPGEVKLTANQLPYSLLTRAVEIEMVDHCRDEGIGIIAYMALMQGILTGKYPSIGDIPEMRKRTRHFNAERNPSSRHGEEGCEEETMQVLAGMRKISDESGISMQMLAIRWILANPDITCTLVGARSREQLEQNLSLSEGSQAGEGYLPSGILEELNSISLPVKERLGNHLDYFEGAVNDRTN